jgi:hypothetical protein
VPGKEEYMKTMKMQQGNKKNQTSLPTPLLIFLFSLFTFFAFSCQTMPKSSDPFMSESNSIPLESGAFAYVIADVPKAMPILNQTDLLKMQTKQLQQMLDKTSSAVIAMYLPQSEKRFRLVSWGNYPVFGAKMALGFNQDWKKQRSKATGAAYWYSAKEGLSVALDKGQAWVLSAEGNTPLEPFSAGAGLSGTPIPEGFNEFSKGAILSCWLNEPGPLINQKLQEMGFPIEIPAEKIFVSVYPTAENQYEAFLRLQVSSATQARALVSVLTLARTFLLLSALDESGGNHAGGGPNGSSTANNGSFELLQAIFFANSPVQDNNYINIKTAILSSTGVALLFNLFSL